MHALDRKLLRDFRRLWAQALAIALVLACGVAVLVTTYGMHRALEATRAAYYDRTASPMSSPPPAARRTLMAEIEAIDGVLGRGPRAGRGDPRSARARAGRRGSGHLSAAVGRAR
jgi:putative ABC transport system permease protein